MKNWIIFIPAYMNLVYLHTDEFLIAICIIIDVHPLPPLYYIHFNEACV